MSGRTDLYADDLSPAGGESSGIVDPMTGTGLARLDRTVSACDGQQCVIRAGTVTRVIDGDTLRVELADPLIVSSASVRIAGINAPERCRATMREWAAAHEYLGGLVRGEKVVLSVTGVDRYGRLVATVVHPIHGDVGKCMLDTGMACRYPSMPGRPLPDMYDRRQLQLPGVEVRQKYLDGGRVRGEE